eukprot:18126-Heterococcus_DN1.PRE.1
MMPVQQATYVLLRRQRYSATPSLYHLKVLPCSCNAPPLIIQSCHRNGTSGSMTTASASSSTATSGSMSQSTLNLDSFAAADAAAAAGDITAADAVLDCSHKYSACISAGT